MSLKKSPQTPQIPASPTSMDNSRILDLVLAEINDIKGDNPVVIDVRQVTDVADYMLVVGGTSSRHIKGIYDRLVKLAKENKLEILSSEGETTSDWILLDLNSIIVHVMSYEARDLYQLEALWSVSPS